MSASVIPSLLILNSGSSSIKFKLYCLKTEINLLAQGQLHGLGSRPVFEVSEKNTSQSKENLPADITLSLALERLFHWLNERKTTYYIKAVSHRIVHGGEHFNQSVELQEEVVEQLKALIPLAPLHQPYPLQAIEKVKKWWPEVRQFACFDTAFHAGHQWLFREYALPESIRQQGVRKYGFHGLSYQWVVHYLKHHEPTRLKGALIAAHLGNGSSICAMKDGVSIDTTMGMTALAGVPMGTRSGDIDPGVVIYLMRELGLSLTEVEHLLYECSGLLGLSGQSNDIRLLQESTNEKARFAIDFYVLKLAQYIGMMAVAVGGIDTLVFTGGIGEHAETIREGVMNYLQFLKPFDMRVIAADEEQIMAKETIALLYSKKR